MKKRLCTAVLALCLSVMPVGAAFAEQEPPGALPAAETQQLTEPQEALPTASPTETPPATPEPTAAPEPTATPEPTAIPESTATPEPTAAPEPTAPPEPTASPEPTAAPEPTATPEPTAAPEPTATPEPAAAPAPENAPQPAAEPDEPAAAQGSVRWQSLPDPAQGSRTSISFYLNLYNRIANYGGTSQGIETENFTQGLESGALTDHPAQFSCEESAGQYIVAQGSSGGSALDVDARIRTLATGLEGFRYAAFPSDAQIFALIRSNFDYYTKGKGIRIDGAAVNAADLTTDKYTIRWYVFKYDTSDAWHVDGILVPRSGRLTVTKVFAGRDAPAGFSVAVDGSYQGAANRYELQTQPYTALDAAAPGYRSRTVGADGSVTYVWQVDVYDAVYRVRENGAAADGYTLDAAYEKSENGAATLRLPYPEAGVAVQCTTAAADEGAARQSVTLYNRYQANRTVTVSKRVRGPAADVNQVFSFTAQVNGAAVSFSLKSGESYTLPGLAPGDTVTVREDAAPGYTAGYAVNGGDAQTGAQVTVQAGDTVEFINTAPGVPDTGLPPAHGILPLLLLAAPAQWLRRRGSRR